MHACKYSQIALELIFTSANNREINLRRGVDDAECWGDSFWGVVLCGKQ